MICPKCGQKSKVEDSRQRAYFRWRRYRCLSCGVKYYTKELVVKLDPRLEEAHDKT